MNTYSRIIKEKNLEVLLIEDDIDLSEFIIGYLEMENIYCDNAINGSKGLQLAQSAEDINYDCIILDLNLPIVDGITVCKTLRDNGIYTPIIMLTARDSLDDRLLGFTNGADDYLCKPFEIKELVARIKALTQRNARNLVLRCDNLVMDISKKLTFRGSKKISLSLIEWKILKLLLSQSPYPVNKKRIIFEIWGDSPPETDSLKVHMHNLRKAVDLPNENTLIHTIPGHGYAVCLEKSFQVKE